MAPPQTKNLAVSQSSRRLSTADRHGDGSPGPCPIVVTATPYTSIYKGLLIAATRVPERAATLTTASG